MKKIIFKSLILLLVTSSTLNANEKIGGEGLALPPIFSSSNSAELIDKSRSVHPSTKPLHVVGTKFKNGDIVFIRTNSIQAKALEEVTKSLWTHVGILFKLKMRGGVPTLVESTSKEGKWYVFEAGPKVRFNLVERFVGNKQFAIQRFKEPIDEMKAKQLFATAQTRIGKPYDVFFLLSRDGVTKDDPDYCSEVVWYVYAKALGVQLGYRQQIGTQNLDGPEAKKLMSERFARKTAPMSLEKWKAEYVIPPQSQFVSPLIERIDTI